MKTARFESMSSFASACDTVKALTRKYHDNKSWTGESWAESISFTRKGNTSLVIEAEALIAAIEARIELRHYEWSHDVAGAFPNVPAYLSNNPENMQRRIHTQSDHAPINLYVDVTSSAGIGFKTLQQRGVAVLALLLKLQATRSVTLNVFSALGYGTVGDTACIVKLSHPVCLSEACYALTSSGFCRNLLYGYQKEMGGGGGWPKERDMRKALAVQPQDIVLGPAHVNSMDEVTKPVEWINAQCKLLEGVQE